MEKTVLARKTLASRGWTLVGQPAPDPVSVMAAAPHTSNWDFPLMLLIAMALDVEPRFLMKREAFRGPAAVLLRKLGGIPVDRSSSYGLVDELVAQATGTDRLALVIAPEGTRKPAKHWKSGFYRIAEKANIPISLGFIDKPTMTLGFGPSIRPSGDIVADMEFIRDFYQDKHGVVPANKTPPRLREEQG